MGLTITKNNMKNIISSATRLTLLMLVFTLCVGTLLQIPMNEPFRTVLLMVIAFYFGQKTNQIVSDAKTLTVENKDNQSNG